MIFGDHEKWLRPKLKYLNRNSCNIKGFTSDDEQSEVADFEKEIQLKNKGVYVGKLLYFLRIYFFEFYSCFAKESSFCRVTILPQGVETHSKHDLRVYPAAMYLINCTCAYQSNGALRHIMNTFFVSAFP